MKNQSCAGSSHPLERRTSSHALPAQHQPVQPSVLIRLPEVLRRTALSKTSIYDLMKAGEFCQSVPLGGKAVAWLESEVEQWIQGRIAAARGVNDVN
ncbi:AlpA family transcriptional regulator [Chitinibacter bivalviorum]|uniref:AlpA family transcriptional regulator n=1 Tax=Chitinibacter bivalviorum TaxID=2739434 RepID=A0A7H9BEM0_9NEIS|nr:AlpA family transcriptional regulator [Chitinibacter bivalviorum]QLG87069.1 AlpA family transcriptional regulator [Chitinibacter bivalviorum]